MIKKRKIIQNNHALSVMYDAVFFIIFVSLSGAILLPAMMNPTAVQSSIDRHREQLVDETLLMIMTSREPEFEYTFAQTQLQEALGVVYDIGVINNIASAMLTREMQHKTYADICADSMISQLYFNGKRINIFLEDYHQNLEETMQNTIQQYLGSRYYFNFTFTWHPIQGLPFGGDLTIGPKPPLTDIYMARSSIGLPKNPFSTTINTINSIIDTQTEPLSTTLDEIETGIEQQDLEDILLEFENQLNENISLLINGLFFDGFGPQSTLPEGIISIVIDYVFELVSTCLSSIFQGPLNYIANLTDTIGENIDVISETLFMGVFLPKINQILPFNINVNTMQDFLAELKDNIILESKQLMAAIIPFYLSQITDKIMLEIQNAITKYQQTGTFEFTIQELQNIIQNFFNKHINLLRAQTTLSLWEA